MLKCMQGKCLRACKAMLKCMQEKCLRACKAVLKSARQMLIQNMGNHTLGPGGLFSDQEQILCWFERFCRLFRNKGANCDLKTSWQNSVWVTLRNVLHMYVVEVQLWTDSANLQGFAEGGWGGGGGSKNKLWLQNILTEFRVILRNVVEFELRCWASAWNSLCWVARICWLFKEQTVITR